MDDNNLESAKESQNQPPSPVNKKTWEAPKLAFVEPKLTKHGELTEVTGQFFGGFSPGSST